MAYWIFKCNPEKYRLPDRLSDPNDSTTWTVAQHKDEIKAGDIAFLWVTGTDRGIRAVLRVDQDPREQRELESEQPYWSERDTQDRLRVNCTLTHRHVNLGHERLREVDGLEDLSVFRGFQQATNFPVTPEQGAIIMRLVRGSWMMSHP
jgi:predicted RNA-binding protein with PUA-like domain